jgi:excinuclease ABC subunit A
MLPVRLTGARTHNLRGVDLTLRPGELVAMTGRSGSGKSSLAIDTLYAEGQRRFVESFSPYARQFLERLERPPIEALDPVAASVAVDRRAPIKSSRSTLATMADLEAYLAGLFGCEAVPVCPTCGVLAETPSLAEVARRITSEWAGAKAILGYRARARATEDFLEIREGLARDGYRKLWVDGALLDIDAVRPSDVTAARGTFDVVIDRVSIGPDGARRLEEALEVAWKRGSGRAEMWAERPAAREKGQLSLASLSPAEHVPIARGLACPKCARTFEPPHPGLFSYNSPLGACEACRGFGRTIAIDWGKVFPDPEKTLEAGAIRPWCGKSSEWERTVLARFAKRKKIPMDVPWGTLTAAQRDLVVEGEGTWTGGKYPGVRAWFRWLEGRTYKMHVRVLLARYREYTPCPSCNTSRLNATALSYRVGGKNLAEWHALSVKDALAATRVLVPRDPQGHRVKTELETRLGYLERVGLGYLSLDRQARTLSGGEAQRAGLTTALGASLTGTMFVLDEPTVGLHPSDVPALGEAMRELSRAGNAVIVIEHDEGIVRSADRIVEMGPGAGKEGGTILYDGPPAGLAQRLDTPTGRAWSRASSASAERPPRTAHHHVTLRGARAHNLRGIDVRIPLGVVTALTGPSGSGKSTLAEGILYRGLARSLGDTSVPRPLEHDALKIGKGAALERVVLVDQAPLGRTARGNAATYTKAWSRIRALFASEPDARRRGLLPGHFSFNVGESKALAKSGGPLSGRCEACSGEGYETVEMQFLADVSILCPACQGKRFRPEVLAVTHRGLNVADVLSLTVGEALALFDPEEAHDPALYRLLYPVARVGLSYLPLGQPLSMLSGGEAQRLKLARALSEPAKGTLFVLDEPSAGLHAQDTSHVIAAMHALVEEGGSVLVVEHDLDVVRGSDWVIDLGPGGGPEGGCVVAEGTPAQVARCDSRTGAALRRSAPFSPPPPVAAEQHEGPVAISVEHAREHNLKDVTCAIPHGKLTVVTGPSGSGKSSLAFDVVFAEGQRRFAETLTPYARQFLPSLPRPDVDSVSGVPPSIALEQRTSRAGTNSTVATVTEIAHYLRLMFAKLGEVFCPTCGASVAPTTGDEVFRRITARPSKTPLTLYSPAVRARKGTYLDVFTAAARRGVTAARVDGSIVAIDPPPRLAKSLEHSIDLIVYYGPPSRLERSVLDQALAWGDGAVSVGSGPPTPKPSDAEDMLSTSRTCTQCGTGVPELDPRLFSFNTRQGQCEACEGTGVEGGPDAALEGSEPCEACGGTRLAILPRRVKLFGVTYPEFLAKDVTSALASARAWKLTGKDLVIGKAPHDELVRRLEFAARVGLGYLALDRPALTLSGGEMQRLRLSAQLGSGLTGALYVLDEPTIGLHPRDTRVLIGNLRELARTGSTVLVVEHDEEVIRAADHVVDLGPFGGRDGGHVMASGSASEVLSDPRSPTADALRETWTRARRPAPEEVRSQRDWIEVTRASANNLKDVTFRVPTKRLVVVAGVSGSGKSTLVRHVFYPALRRALGLVAEEPGAHRAIRGVGSGAKLGGVAGVKRALAVDQSPIGRTPRSVPATFLGIWDDIRKLFASLPEARARGYGPARFSFNASAGGRCTACEGQGSILSEMAFLPDVVAPCEACRGARFEPRTLDVRYSGRSIAEVLHLTAEEAARVFAVHPRIARPLETLTDLGVGYVEIGQGSNTLSGGEAQRLKLAAELTAKTGHEPTVYVLDEPTTGLHVRDVRRLVDVLDRLVMRGDTLVVIEHHPDVIANADWVVELGPDAGAAGGEIVFEGDPRGLRKAKTATGRYFASRTGSRPPPTDSTPQSERELSSA